jgi:hypothetical protein
MKYLLKLVFCIAVLVSAGGVDVYGAVRIVGDGGISFDGTGSLLVQRFPELVFERFDSNCTPSPFPGIIFVCRQPLDMSLLGNDIVRAEHVRIATSLHDLRIGVFLRFGCLACVTSVVADDEEDLVLAAGGWRLSDQKTQALQALIDQHGAMSNLHEHRSKWRFCRSPSSVRAVAMDIKPDDVPNTLNLRSRGVVPIAILTTEQFDATSIDLTSLRFGVSGKEAAALRAVFDDVDGDGDTDLLVFFRSQDTTVDCETLFTYISGVTLTGVSIAGTDSVAMVVCH